MRWAPLENRLDYVTRLARMKPRGRGYGVKGSSHTIFWPDYGDYRLGVLIGMLYGDGNLMRRSTALMTGKWMVEFCEGDAGIVREYAWLMQEVFTIKPTIRDRLTWQEAYYRSRICYEFLTYVGEHPDGKKTGKLCFPEVVSDITTLSSVSSLDCTRSKAR